MGQRSIVVEEDESLFHAIVHDLDDAGQTLCAGWPSDDQVDSSEAETMWFGRIDDDDDQHAALLAAIRGVDLLVYLPGVDGRASFLDDLGRVGVVEIRTTRLRDRLLDDDQRALLGLLVEGATMAEASRTLHLSLRTAQRRMARTRTVLGARSTGEAVQVARSRGLC